MEKTEKLRHPVDIHVGRRLRLIRKQRRLSLVTLSDRVSLTFQQIQKLERAHTQLSPRHLYELAQALEVTPNWFFKSYSGDGPAGINLAQPGQLP
jgi:transcriptional regulator with XRE-family HTH domain